MTYGLECEGVYMTLVMSPRSSDSDPSDWRVEARAKRALQEDVIEVEWGPTRIEALRAVGRTWDVNARTHGLRVFKWEDVARVLNEVRAL